MVVYDATVPRLARERLEVLARSRGFKVTDKAPSPEHPEPALEIVEKIDPFFFYGTVSNWESREEREPGLSKSRHSVVMTLIPAGTDTWRVVVEWLGWVVYAALPIGALGVFMMIVIVETLRDGWSSYTPVQYLVIVPLLAAVLVVPSAIGLRWLFRSLGELRRMKFLAAHLARVGETSRTG